MKLLSPKVVNELTESFYDRVARFSSHRAYTLVHVQCARIQYTHKCAYIRGLRISENYCGLKISRRFIRLFDFMFA